MRCSTLSAVAATLAAALAAPALTHVVHERRDVTPDGWVISHKLAPDAVMPVSIGLAQSNMDKIEDYLMDVSDPVSANYGNHWSASDVRNMFAPKPETIESVRDWLVSSGIDTDRVRLSPSAGWLRINMTVAEAESLLHTTFHLYEHEETGVPQVACKYYKVPEAIQKHIDFITPTVHFDAKVYSPKDRNLRKRSLPKDKLKFGPIAMESDIFPTSDSLAKKLQNCTQYITPACLRALYGIPLALSNVQNDPYGIVEFTPQSYYQPDMDLFFKTYSPKQKQTTPNLYSIDGGFVNTQPLGFGLNGESNLDLQYAMALVNPISVTLLQTGDQVESGSFNTFLDAIDGSYCTFQGGDDPNYDPHYPDPYTDYYGAYEGPLNCGGYSAPKVISTSYSYPTEYYLSLFYMQRQCSEYAKLGMMGTTFLFSSGDTGVGVSGTDATCIGQDSTFGNPNFVSKGGRFTVGFPSNCPYITSVGATQVKPDTSVLDANPEEAAVAPLDQGDGTVFVLASGGGFSDAFAVPKYQKKAVKSYLKNYPPSYPASRFNNTGMSRGAPDISANGVNYTVVINGFFYLVDGTSASSPTIGAIIAIINQQRKLHNKPAIGFINPVLYANPELFQDITSGTNPGCGTPGFKATPGWDPVTGLGTPNVPKLLQQFVKY